MGGPARTARRPWPVAPGRTTVKQNTVLALGALVAICAIIWLIHASSQPAAASNQPGALLAAMSQSGVSGSVSFTPQSNGQATSVTVNLSGLQANSVYGVTINNGACLGPQLFILSGVIGDSSGQGSSTTTVPAPAAATWFIAVHASASPDAPVVACGQAQVGAQGSGTLAPVSTATPTSSVAIPAQNPTPPLQLPNGGGGPPRQPIPTPGR
jgi:hypothetical protein